MQSLNEKPYSLHFTTKKFNSCDDCNEEFKESGKIRLNQLKTLPESFLARRRIQTGFSLSSINTKLNKRKYSSYSFNEILYEMKAKISNRDNISCKSHWHGEEDYLFVNPQISNSYPKQDKDLRINSFLNSLGIFQLNLGVALKDYNY